MAFNKIINAIYATNGKNIFLFINVGCQDFTTCGLYLKWFGKNPLGGLSLRGYLTDNVLGHY